MKTTDGYDEALDDRLYRRLAGVPLTQMAQICADEMAAVAGVERRETRMSAHLAFALSRLATDIVTQAYALTPAEIIEAVAPQFIAKIDLRARARLEASRALGEGRAQ